MATRNPAVQAKSRLIAHRTKQPPNGGVLSLTTLCLNKPKEKKQQAPKDPIIPFDFDPSLVFQDTIILNHKKQQKLTRSSSTTDQMKRLIYQNKTISYNTSNLQRIYQSRKSQLQNLRSRFNLLQSIFNSSKPSEIKSPTRFRSDLAKFNPASPQLRKERQFMRQDTEVLVRMLGQDSEDQKNSDTSDTGSTSNLVEDYENCKQENDRLVGRNQELRGRIEEIKRLVETYKNKTRVQERIEMLEMENKDLHKLIDSLSELIKGDAERMGSRR